MAVKWLYLILLVYIVHLSANDHRPNLFCAPQCHLPDVGQTFCRQISVLLLCKSSRYVRDLGILGKTKEDQFRCGCLWRSTLTNLSTNSHIAKSRPFINCKRISELCCDRYNQLTSSKANKTAKISEKLFHNFTGSKWAKTFIQTFSKELKFIESLPKQDRQKGEHKLATFLKDVILSAKVQVNATPTTAEHRKEDSGNVSTSHHGKHLHKKDQAHYQIQRNSTGHYMTLGSHVFNLADPNWIHDLSKYTLEMRDRISAYPNRTLREESLKALGENVRLFLYAIKKDHNLDSPHTTKKVAETKQPSQNTATSSNTTNNVVQTKQPPTKTATSPNTTKKVEDTKQPPPIQATSHHKTNKVVDSKPSPPKTATSHHKTNEVEETKQPPPKPATSHHKTNKVVDSKPSPPKTATSHHKTNKVVDSKPSPPKTATSHHKTKVVETKPTRTASPPPTTRQTPTKPKTLEPESQRIQIKKGNEVILSSNITSLADLKRQKPSGQVTSSETVPVKNETKMPSTPKVLETKTVRNTMNTTGKPDRATKITANVSSSSLALSHRVPKISSTEPKDGDTGPIRYTDAKFLTDKRVELKSTQSFESTGWTSVKSSQVTKEDILGTLQKRQRIIYFFVGCVITLTLLIICCLWAKRRADEKKQARTANTEQMGDLDLLIQNRKRKSCWEKCCSCFGSKDVNAEQSQIVLYPDIKAMRKTVYGGQTKPKMIKHADDNSHATSGQASKGKDSDIEADDDFEIFHHRLLRGYETEINSGMGTNDVKGSKSN